MIDSNWTGLNQHIREFRTVHHVGRVMRVEGPVIWIGGLAQHASIGERLRLYRRIGGTLDGDILMIRSDEIAMMPDLTAEGVGRDDRVALIGPATISPSDAWVGRIIDPYGRPLDDRPLLPGPVQRAFHAEPPAAAKRRALGDRLTTGLNLLDTLLPIARGQRVGLFAGSGVGKSTLTAHLAKHVPADVVVLALIGERGRELRDFVVNKLGPEGMKKAVVVAATSDRSAVDRRRCALAGMTVAEHFRDQGAHVFFVADSITRFAEAHRETALASGEMPALRGFPASTAQHLMALCERAGPGVDGGGDITALLSVLVAGSDMEGPIADILRGVLDGHFVLDRQIAERGRYPAVDVLRSVSRCLPDAASEEENQIIGQIRRLLQTYETNQTMLRAGLYREGTDAEIDQAIRIHSDLEHFLTGRHAGTPEAAFGKLRLLLRRSEPPGQRTDVSRTRA